MNAEQVANHLLDTLTLVGDDITMYINFITRNVLAKKKKKKRGET